MSDLYYEHLVKKVPTAADSVKRFALIGGTVVLTLAGLLLFPIILIPALALGIATYFLLPGLDLEYEYLLINKSLDIDKIMSKQKRKRIKSFDLGQTEVIAPLNSHRLDYYNANPSIKVEDYSSWNPEHKRYAFIIRSNDAAAKVIFEPDETMVQILRQTMPSKVFLE